MDTLSPPTGQLLDGRYRVESRLARGGMATVYLARDIRLDRAVAIKIAHPELATDQDFVRRFMAEARAVAQLSSPNVVAVFDQGSAGTVNYIAMEYVPGPTLREVLNARGALTVRESLDVIEGVLAGLAAAHRAGIIHRDVKPENVLLGAAGMVKVADFGLARAAAAAAQTKTGMLIGTAAYLAPEQVSRSASDARTDVYAAGIMLFEMLTGVQPHTGESPLVVAYKHVNDVVPPPSSLVPELPVALDALVALATSRDPDLRPADAGQLLHAVTEVRHGTPVSAVRRGQHAAGDGRHAAIAPGDAPADEDADTDLGPAIAAGHAYPPGRPAQARHQEAALAEGGPAEAWPPEAWPPAAPDQEAGAVQHTLIVPAGTFVPGFGGPGDAQAGRGHHGQEAGDFGPDREPPLQRLLFSRRLLYVLGILALALIAVLAGWWLTAGQDAKVPQVRGLAAATARSRLEGSGFKVSDGTPRHSNLRPGSVVSSAPLGGATARHGATVTLILSLGPLRVQVPPVTGQQLQAAEQQLRTRGLTPGPTRDTTSTTIAAGVVISTDPVAGTMWPRNKPVGMTVSAGPPLPNFVGSQEAAASLAAKAGGYRVDPVTDAHSKQPAGTVTRQSPAAGTPIHPGEVVTVYVSPGPPQVRIPDVKGMRAAQAEAALEQAGFQVSVHKGFGGTVTGYSPAGRAPAGTTITINVGFNFF